MIFKRVRSSDTRMHYFQLYSILQLYALFSLYVYNRVICIICNICNFHAILSVCHFVKEHSFNLTIHKALHYPSMMKHVLVIFLYNTLDSIMDMHKMISITSLPWRKSVGIENHHSDFSIWFVLYLSDSMWSWMEVWLVAWKTMLGCLEIKLITKKRKKLFKKFNKPTYRDISRVSIMWSRMRIWIIAWKTHDGWLLRNDCKVFESFKFFGQAASWRGVTVLFHIFDYMQLYVMQTKHHK